MPKILIIDDDKAIRKTFSDILTYESYEVETAQDGQEGLQKIEENEYDVIICDIKMPKIDGMEVLERLLTLNQEIPLVMITGHGNVETAVEAIKKGAFDFIEKPLDLNRVLITIRNAINRNSLLNETRILKRKVSKNYEMIGESAGIKHIKDIIEKVATTDARVLITGENGTGKEIVARWLHEKSNRASFPFIEVNCAAIPSELIESELFGHEKGAFTSAIKQRKGKFEQAHQGTIFLDEIGDMSLSAQAKVLRVLQENKISRVGSDKEIKVDVRVIAATNKNLKEEISKNMFREDLYHRIGVILIEVPPLAKRLEDIPLLAEYFVSLICSEYGVHKKIVSQDAIEVLQRMTWTGNIREFRNVIERLIILCDNMISGSDVVLYAQPLR